MGRFIRVTCAAGLALSAAAHVVTASAQGQSQAVMRIGATVAPRCTISLDESVVSADRSPTVRVVCSRSGLRALRVTTSRGDSIEPTTTFTRAQLLAGGEVVFVVPVVLATVASSLPVIAPPPPPDRSPVTVTLDF